MKFTDLLKLPHGTPISFRYNKKLVTDAKISTSEASKGVIHMCHDRTIAKFGRLRVRDNVDQLGYKYTIEYTYGNKTTDSIKVLTREMDYEIY